MDKIKVYRDGEKDITFSGELIAKTSSSCNNASSNYSGSTGRWSELELYRTAGGKFVCHQIGRTQWQGENDRHSAKVCTTHEEIVEFFGCGWLAKKLFQEANIDAAEKVD